MVRTRLMGILVQIPLAAVASPLLAQPFLPENVQVEHQEVAPDGHIQAVYFYGESDAAAGALLELMRETTAPAPPAPAIATYGADAMNFGPSAGMRVGDLCTADGAWRIAVSADGHRGSARRMNGENACPEVLPLDGEGGLPRSGKTEGVKAPGASKSLKVTHSTTPAACSPSPIKGEDLPITEAAS